MRTVSKTPEEILARGTKKARLRSRLNIGACIAAQLEPLRSSADVAKMMQCSPQYVIQLQNQALWKIATKMKEMANAL